MVPGELKKISILGKIRDTGGHAMMYINIIYIHVL